jgi:plastocyanin
MRALRLSVVALAAALLIVFANVAIAGAAPSHSPRTYKVLVGAENARRGIDVMAYFPSDVRVHVGDTVHFVQNSFEIHTVTFLGGAQLPELILPAAILGLPPTPSPLVFNPVAMTRTASPVSLANTTTWANSGVMGKETGQFRTFDVTFTAQGTYTYVCVVHGMMMSGKVTVVGAGTSIASPNQVTAIAHRQIARQFAKAPHVLHEARKQIQSPTKNVDGTMTHQIMVGYSKGLIDLMRFFPRRVNVRPGDKVVWTLSPSNRAPHTVTFLNGQPEPPLIDLVTPPGGTAVPYVAAGTFFPSMPTPELTRTGLYSSGLVTPPPPGTGSWSIVVGDVTSGPLRYICLLHDASGMRGTLQVLPR